MSFKFNLPIPCNVLSGRRSGYLLHREGSVSRIKWRQHKSIEEEREKIVSGVLAEKPKHSQNVNNSVSSGSSLRGDEVKENIVGSFEEGLDPISSPEEGEFSDSGDEESSRFLVRHIARRFSINHRDPRLRSETYMEIFLKTNVRRASFYRREGVFKRDSIYYNSVVNEERKRERRGRHFSRKR